MKKIMIAFMAVATAAVSLAGYYEDKERALSLTLADYQAKYEQAMATGAITKGLCLMHYRNDLNKERLEFDAGLASKGLCIGSWMYSSFPQSALVGIENWKTNAPVFYRVFKEEPVTSSDFAFLSGQKANFVDQILLLREMRTKKSPIYGPTYVKVLRNGMMRNAQKSIKRWLRSHGQSFVAKEGYNPVQDHLDALAKVLDAPRFDGLEKWAKDHDLDVTVDVSDLPDETELAKLKEAILYGDKPLDGPNQLTLMICLGVEGYNAFVKEYNGDK